MKMRNINFLLLITGVITITSCSFSRHPSSPLYDPNNSGFEYAPAMYHSWPYEPLSQVTDPEATSWHKNSMPHNDYKGSVNSNSLTPVAGTIARGKLAYYDGYNASDESRAKASTELKNSVELTDFTLMEGRRLYNLYCDHCHGEKGDAQGTLNEVGFAPGPYYSTLKDRTEGSIYHTITYGKGVMGSHASQLSPEQRWKIVHWVQTLQLSETAHEVRSLAARNALTGVELENQELHESENIEIESDSINIELESINGNIQHEETHSEESPNDHQ